MKYNTHRGTRVVGTGALSGVCGRATFFQTDLRERERFIGDDSPNGGLKHVTGSQTGISPPQGFGQSYCTNSQHNLLILLPLLSPYPGPVYFFAFFFILSTAPLASSLLRGSLLLVFTTPSLLQVGTSHFRGSLLEGFFKGDLGRSLSTSKASHLIEHREHINYRRRTVYV